MNFKNFQQARYYAEKRLERELSPILVYHGIAHTREEVVPAAETLAGMEGIRDEALYLLLTAAWFHDLGYVEQALYHELISQRIAVQVLPSMGYNSEEVEIVRWAILATALPQLPRNPIDAILVDADLDVLGRSNFMQRNDDLRRELTVLDKELSDRTWFTSQLKFLENHQYFTASARQLRDAQKRLNVAHLKAIIETLPVQDAA